MALLQRLVRQRHWLSTATAYVVWVLGLRYRSVSGLCLHQWCSRSEIKHHLFHQCQMASVALGSSKQREDGDARTAALVEGTVSRKCQCICRTSTPSDSTRGRTQQKQGKGVITGGVHVGQMEEVFRWHAVLEHHGSLNLFCVGVFANRLLWGGWSQEGQSLHPGRAPEKGA